MCCFSAPTHVHGTKIFARLPKAGAQLLAYQMEYRAEKPTAMILPLPVALPAREDSVRFRSLKEYASFFSDLAAAFPVPRARAANGAPAAAAAAAPSLVVHEVGDFIASFVPQIRDFARVDRRFVIDKDVWAKIPEYADYGFAVFQLKNLEGTPHPMAFEFDTRLVDRLFFPTVHIHDGSFHPTDTFDHVLYLQAPSFDAKGSGDGFVRSAGPAGRYVDASRGAGLVEPDLHVHKTTISGTQPNADRLYAANAVAATAATSGVTPPQTAATAPAATPPSAPPAGGAGGCGRCDVAAGTATGSFSLPLAVMTGLAWVIRRRNTRPT